MNKIILIVVMFAVYDLIKYILKKIYKKLRK